MQGLVHGCWHLGHLFLLPVTGLPVLLTNMELSLGCQELHWLLSREDLSPPHVQPGFCLYLSTTLPIHALERGKTRGQHNFVGPQNHSKEGFIHLGSEQAQNCDGEPNFLSTLPLTLTRVS